MDWLPWIPTLVQNQYIAAGVVKESDEEDGLCQVQGNYHKIIIALSFS